MTARRALHFIPPSHRRDHVGINQQFLKIWLDCEALMNRIDHNTEEAVHRFLALIASRYDVVEAIVYGSRARGTHRPDSDVDVAVLLRGEHQRFLTAKLDMADIAFDVLLETGILISPLPVWLDEWENPESYCNPALLRNIHREGVRL